MISLYSGTPGSGKSYHVAQLVYDKVKYEDCLIISNFEVDLHEIKRKRGKYIWLDNTGIKPRRLAKFAKHYITYRKNKKHKTTKEGHIVLIIDEAQLLFNAREWNACGRNDWNWFFTQHRHYKFDIIFIAQFDRMLDRYIRCLIEYEYVHRKINNFGIGGKIVSILCLGKNAFMCVKKWYPMRERVGAEILIASNKYYRIYDTTTIFDG